MSPNQTSDKTQSPGSGRTSCTSPARSDGSWETYLSEPDREIISVNQAMEDFFAECDKAMLRGTDTSSDPQFNEAFRRLELAMAGEHLKGVLEDDGEDEED
ncbi:hypothetical protein TWF281_004742 [Arthrobotrys megalospora]